MLAWAHGAGLAASYVPVARELWSVKVQSGITALAVDGSEVFGLAGDVGVGKGGTVGAQYLLGGGRISKEGVGPGFPVAALIAGGQLYIAGVSPGPHASSVGANEVQREDPSTLVRNQDFSVEGPYALASQGGAVWALSAAGKSQSLTLDRLGAKVALAVRHFPNLGLVPGSPLSACDGDLLVAGATAGTDHVVLEVSADGATRQQWTLGASYAGMYLACVGSTPVVALGGNSDSLFALGGNGPRLLAKVNGVVSSIAVVGDRIGLASWVRLPKGQDEVFVNEFSLNGAIVGRFEIQASRGGALLGGSDGQFVVAAYDKVWSFAA
jgi:hypothetical protein